MARWRIMRWIVSVLAVVAIMIIILAILGPTIGGTGQITQTKLDAESLPTAEYLFNNPRPTPQGFPVSLVVEQDAQGFSLESFNVEVFCIQGFVPRDARVNVEFDHNPVDGAFSKSLGGLRSDTGRTLSHCIEGVVDTGLHLLSVEMTSDSWAETYSYTWAVEITNEGYNYIPDYLLRHLVNH